MLGNLDNIICLSISQGGTENGDDFWTIKSQRRHKVTYLIYLVFFEFHVYLCKE